MPLTDIDALLSGLGMDRASQFAVLEEMQERLAGHTDQLRVLLRLVPLAGHDARRLRLAPPPPGGPSHLYNPRYYTAVEHSSTRWRNDNRGSYA